MTQSNNTPLVVTVGTKDLGFNVEIDDYNKYINETQPNEKVKPAFNFLSRTVTEDCREAFTNAVMVNGKPNGLIVLQIVGVLIEDFGGDVEISLKKPKALPAG